jgi:hypothetical protein
MPNSDTTFRSFIRNATPQYIGASSTSEFQLTDTQSAAITLTAPLARLQSGLFVVRFCGQLKRAAGNLTLKLYAGLLGGTVFASSGTVTAPTTGPFDLKVECMPSLDATNIGGIIHGHVGGVLVSDTAISLYTFIPDATTSVLSQVTGPYSAALNPALPQTVVFSTTAQFSASNAGNGAKLDGIEIDLV